MPSNQVRIEEIPLGHPRLRCFVNFPWLLYRNNICWTPPLMAELLGNGLLRMPGLLTPRHPYHREAEVTHFIAWREDKPVGRISAAINHRFNNFHKGRFGFFGFFDVIDDYEISRILLDRAREWLQKRGMAVMRGPGEYSCATHERQGVLINGFNSPNCFDTTYNYSYYSEFLERYGFAKAKDYLAFSMDLSPQTIHADMLSWTRRYTSKLRQRARFETRSVTPKSLDTDIRLIMDIYNDSWAQNWGFLPLTDTEIEGLASYLRIFYDPGLVRLAFVRGEPAAMLGIIPDPNWCFRPLWRWYGDSDVLRISRLLTGRRQIRRLRWFFFGVKERFRILGADMLLTAEALDYYMTKRRYQFIEASLILEDNWRTVKALETMGMRHTKTWRIYDLAL